VKKVPLRLLEGYRGYQMTDDYASYNAAAAQSGIERLACWAHARRKFVEAQKVQPKGNPGRADMALNLINKLYGIERDLKESSDTARFDARQQRSQPILRQSKAWLDKTQPQIEGGRLGEQTRLFARHICLQPVTTPVRSPQSNGKAKGCVKKLKRDYLRTCPSRIEKQRCAT